MLYTRYFIIFRPLSLKEALDYLAEIWSDDEPNTLYIEPPEIEDGALSGEDDAEDEEGGLPDNVCPGQLKANCEIVFQNGLRVDSFEEILRESREASENEPVITDEILTDVTENSERIEISESDISYR